MGRYTLEFKLSVVEYFLSGQGGQKLQPKGLGQTILLFAFGLLHIKSTVFQD